MLFILALFAMKFIKILKTYVKQYYLELYLINLSYWPINIS